MTKKELVLQLRAEGLSYREIENRTGICRSLISYHCTEQTRDKTRHRTTIARKHIRFKIWEYKANKGCKICGETNPVCLDLHHKDPGQKSFCVSHFEKVTQDWNVVRKEIEKCDVLCANCHRKHHGKNAHWFHKH